MPLRITLVRHGRSEANDASIWQGQGNSPLSGEGRAQAVALAARLADHPFDLIVSSDLARARATAEALGRPVEIDASFREMDLGGWEGRHFEEVAAEHPDLLEAIRSGEAVRFGGTGETSDEFEQRCLAALDSLAHRVGEGSVLVATHGGVIDAIVGARLGRIPGRRTFPIVTNTSLTVLRGQPGRLRLARFNDATHLGVDVGFVGRMRSDGVPLVAFVRHGLTEANKIGRIQGQSCWGLAPEGVDQAKALAAWYPTPDRVVSSPSPRAVDTAGAFGLEVTQTPELLEMSFGEWEGMLTSDVRTTELGRRIFEDRHDLRRGGSGESFADLVRRMSGFLGAFRPDPTHRTVVVSHGGSIRAVVAGIHQRGPDIERDVGYTLNTSVTHVAITETGPVLGDYALAPHLAGE